MRWQLSIPIVIVIIVIMFSVARHAAVSHTHFERTLKPEGQDRIARNPYRPPARLAAADRSDNRAHQTVVTGRLHVIVVGPDCIALPVDRHRFKIQIEIVIPFYTDDQFHRGPARNRESSVATPDVL